MPYNSNDYAYDLFAERKEPIRKPQLRVVKQNKFRLKELKGVFALTAVAFVMVGVFITNQATYNEYNKEYCNKKNELATLEKTYSALEIQEINNMNIMNVEDYAINVLGMQQPEPEQIERISLAGEDKFVTTSESGNEGFLTAVKNFFKNML